MTAIGSVDFSTPTVEKKLRRKFSKLGSIQYSDWQDVDYELRKSKKKAKNIHKVHPFDPSLLQ